MDTVIENLVHQQLWTDCKIYNEDANLIRGTPPRKLHPEDAQISSEYVLVSHMRDLVSVRGYTKTFQSGHDASRVVHAVIAEDSTIAYYIVYKSLNPPRRN